MTDTIKIIESQQVFAKNMYLDFMSKRFGITPCCISDLPGSKIKKQLCDWNELKKDIPTITSMSSEIFIPSPYSEPNFPCLDPLAPTWCRDCGYFIPDNANELYKALARLDAIVKELCVEKEQLEAELLKTTISIKELEAKKVIVQKALLEFEDLLEQNTILLKELEQRFLEEGCEGPEPPDSCESLQEELKSTLVFVDKLAQEVDAYSQQLKDIESIIVELNNTITELTEKIAKVQTQIDEVDLEIQQVQSLFCDDSECITVSVIDEHGDPVEGYQIIIDGGNSGYTDSNGMFEYNIPNASVDTKHTLQICYCFETAGNCRQQKINIVVNTGKDKVICEVLQSCDQIDVVNTIMTPPSSRCLLINNDTPANDVPKA